MKISKLETLEESSTRLQFLGEQFSVEGKRKESREDTTLEQLHSSIEEASEVNKYLY